jgi:hypothetical protein
MIDLGVDVVNLSYVGSFYIMRYDLWNLGFLNGPKISFKQSNLDFSL